jgi:Zn-dependent protease
VAVIVIHEAGHFIAMRAFGYANVHMMFIPLLGAYVSGKPGEVHPAKKLIVLFAGPLPGILIGMVCAMIYSRGQQHLLYQLALMFIFLNVFNLMPLAPMDGGQILGIVFPRSGRWIQTGFILAVALAIVYYIERSKNYVLVLILLLLANRLFSVWRRRDSEEATNETEPQVGLSRNEKIVSCIIWLVAILIPLQTLYRII